MTLVYIIGGVVLLTTLSLAGIYFERQQKRRFEKEELARLLARSPTASNGKSPEPMQTRSGGVSMIRAKSWDRPC